MTDCKIRQAQWLDKAVLHDMDLKCFDDPWEESYWLYWFDDERMVLIVEVGGKAAGFLAGALMEDGLVIEKIGVKPLYRRHGVSRVLIDGCHDISMKCSEKPQLHKVVPEPWLYPDSPDCIAEWVRVMNFKARLPYLKDYFCINEVEMDGVRCTLEDH
jgi:GNAT superfamily N-acetyltransferase